MKNTIEYKNQENQESAKNVIDRINPPKPKPEDIIHHISISKFDLEFLIKSTFEMGRLEAFALGNKPYDSVLDGFGSALGYSWIILAVAFFRELLGSGAVFGLPVYESISSLFGPDFKLATNGLMVSPVGAFIILGLIIWVQRTKTGYVEH